SWTGQRARITTSRLSSCSTTPRTCSPRAIPAESRPPPHVRHSAPAPARLRCPPRGRLDRTSPSRRSPPKSSLGICCRSGKGTLPHSGRSSTGRTSRTLLPCTAAPHPSTDRCTRRHAGTVVLGDALQQALENVHHATRASLGRRAQELLAQTDMEQFRSQVSLRRFPTSAL